MGKTRKDEQRQTNLNSNPDDADNDLKNPVKSRVCGAWTCKLQQIYNNFTTSNEE